MSEETRVTAAAAGPVGFGEVLGRWAAHQGMPADLLRRAVEAGPLPAEPHRETAEEAAERRKRQDRAKALLWEERIPEVNRYARLDSLLDQQDPRGAVSRFLTADRPVLLLMGPGGHGKSNAAVAVGREVRVQGGRCVYWTAPDLRDALWADRFETREEGDSRRTALDAVLTADLLLLDDLGRERADNRWGTWTEQLWTILHGRSENGKLTVITANATDEAGQATDQAGGLDMLERRYGYPVARRIVDFCVGAWIEGEPLAPPPLHNPFGGA